MKAQKGQINKQTLQVLLLVLGLLSAGFSQAAVEHTFNNGITAVIYSPEEILADPGVTGIQLAQADRTYFPFDQNVVLKALEDMSGFDTQVQIQVFLLPAPPAHVNSSYASKSTIYLSPGIGPVAESTVAYITTHEMGHVLTSAFMDGDSARWNAYMELRGLDSVANGPSAAHADRAREILAEDFRYLFGGRLATISGSIENHDLALPTHVFGLEELLVEFVAGRAPAASLTSCRAFPNPCNPRTTVAMGIGSGAAVNANTAVLRVFDIRGALVRTLVGGQLMSDQVEITWNGDDHSGASAASGQYLYVMQVGSLQAKGSVTLVR
jgi:hypothetical protein